MRIQLLNQYFPPDASATAYLIGELAEDLSVDHGVRVIAGRPSYNAESSTFTPHGASVIRTWSTTYARAGMLGRVLNYGTFLISALIRCLRGPRPDVVIAFTDPPVIGLIGLVAARRHRVPFVYVCMDIFPDVGVALGLVDNPILVRGWRALNGLLRRRASRIVAVGRDMAEKLESEGVPRDKIRVLTNWANEPPPILDINSVRDQMGWHGKRIVMHAGNMGLAQNLDIVLEAAGILSLEAPEVQFVFMGDGASRERLMSEAHRRLLTNISFLDYVPKDEAQATIAAANLHLVSLAPGLKGSAVPSKVYGLLAAGMPFAAAVDEDSEIDLMIRDYGCGLHIAPGDGATLAKVIVATSDNHLWEMGRNARRAFEERYSRSLITGAYRSMIEETVGSARSPDVVHSPPLTRPSQD